MQKRLLKNALMYGMHLNVMGSLKNAFQYSICHRGYFLLQSYREMAKL